MLKELLGEEKYLNVKESDNILYKALEISSIIFKHDVDKGGLPYSIHMLYVYRHVDTIEEKVVALLHDIMEEKNITEEELLDIGFSKKIVDDIKILTRVKPSEYNDYIDDIVKNGSKEALTVKLADVKHNMDMSRIKNPTVKDYERVEKRYAPAYTKILNRLEEIK
ncbi:MAG: GTP pyrophosphokinase [Bacilli bacterium]|nr:GTP pyrophosphokinase [Bacilli bacterium]